MKRTSPGIKWSSVWSWSIEADGSSHLSPPYSPHSLTPASPEALSPGPPFLQKEGHVCKSLSRLSIHTPAHFHETTKVLLAWPHIRWDRQMCRRAWRLRQNPNLHYCPWILQTHTGDLPVLLSSRLWNQNRVHFMAVSKGEVNKTYKCMCCTV